MVTTTSDHYGRVDVLCNNAGILLFEQEARAHELTNETWDRTMALNLRGYWLCSKYVIPSMLETMAARSLTSPLLRVCPGLRG